MDYLVLKELPQGQQPGETIDLPEAVGDVFELVGAVRKLAIEPPKPPRGRYRRSDLQPESRDLVAEP